MNVIMGHLSDCHMQYGALFLKRFFVLVLKEIARLLNVLQCAEAFSSVQLFSGMERVHSAHCQSLNHNQPNKYKRRSSFSNVEFDTNSDSSCRIPSLYSSSFLLPFLSFSLSNMSLPGTMV